MTNDLDEYALAALQTAPVDSYGVGAHAGHRLRRSHLCDGAELHEREGADGTIVPVMKKSKDKATVPGRKLAFRSYEYALAEAERVISGSEEKLAGFTPKPLGEEPAGRLCGSWADRRSVAGHDAVVRSTSSTPRRCPRLPSPRRAS